MHAHLLYLKEEIILGVVAVSVTENNIKAIWAFLKFPKMVSLLKGKGFFFSSQQLLLTHPSGPLTAQFGLCHNRRASGFVNFVAHVCLSERREGREHGGRLHVSQAPV